MFPVCVAVILLVIISGCSSITPTTFLTQSDKQRFLRVFQSAHPFEDVRSTYFSVAGYIAMDKKYENKQEACEYFKKNMDVTLLSSIHHAAAGAALLGDCQLKIGDNVKQLLETTLANTKVSIEDLYGALMAMKHLKINVDAKRVPTLLDAALKRDSSHETQAHIFHLAAEFVTDKKELQKYFNEVADALQQSDEENGKYQFFDSGLYMTSFLLEGMFKLCAKFDKEPVIKDEQLVKFAEYLMRRRSIYQVRAAYQLVAAVKAMSTNKFKVPVVVTLANQQAITEANKKLTLRVTDLWGTAVGPVGVTVTSVRDTRSGGGGAEIPEPVAGGAELRADGDVYSGPTTAAVHRAAGVYACHVKVDGKRAKQRLLPALDVTIPFKVTTSLAVENVEISVADIGQSSAPKVVKVNYPSKASTAVQADHHQRLGARFQLRDVNSNKQFQAHQTFIRLVNSNSGAENIYVAQVDKANVFKFGVDVKSAGKDFKYASGNYGMHVIIGDALVENPIEWHLADLALEFGPAPVPPKAGEALDTTIHYEPRPEIEHLFRVPDKRAAPTISLAFTALCVLPLLVLLVAWLRLGANLSGLASVNPLWALGFHGLFGAIMALYVFYWLQLDMFHTIYALLGLGVGVAFFGRQLLKQIAAESGSCNTAPGGGGAMSGKVT